jgi:hypothetical protein
MVTRNGSRVSFDPSDLETQQRASFGTAETMSKQRKAKQRAKHRVNRMDVTHCARVRANAMRKATMNKGNRLLLHSSPEHVSPNNAFDIALPPSDLDIQDNRVVQLLVLLQQLNTSAGGLGALPDTELGEVIASAVRLCGFLNPIEERDVSATVLEALKMKDPIPEHR